MTETELIIESLGIQLAEARSRRKEAEAAEKVIKAELSELWGHRELKTESRIFGSVRITVSRRERSSFNTGEVRRYLMRAGKLALLDQVASVAKGKLEKLVKKGEMPWGILDLVQADGSYEVWGAEELEED